MAGTHYRLAHLFICIDNPEKATSIDPTGSAAQEATKAFQLGLASGLVKKSKPLRKNYHQWRFWPQVSGVSKVFLLSSASDLRKDDHRVGNSTQEDSGFDAEGADLGFDAEDIEGLPDTDEPQAQKTSAINTSGPKLITISDMKKMKSSKIPLSG